MVSAQAPGIVRAYKQSPSGHKTLLFQERVERLAGAGGASEGAATAVQTQEKWATVNSNVPLVNDDILIMTFESDGAITLDATDSIQSVPLVTAAGTKSIGRAQFANPALADNAYVAGIETVAAGYKIVENQAVVKGRIFYDLQDSA